MDEKERNRLAKQNDDSKNNKEKSGDAARTSKDEQEDNGFLW